LPLRVSLTFAASILLPCTRSFTAKDKDTIERDLRELQNPTQLLKFGASESLRAQMGQNLSPISAGGKPGFRAFNLSAQCDALKWESKKTKSADKCRGAFVHPFWHVAQS
jgi:hypothetical protein